MQYIGFFIKSIMVKRFRTMLIAGGNASLYPSIGGIFAFDAGSLSSRVHWDTGSAYNYSLLVEVQILLLIIVDYLYFILQPIRRTQNTGTVPLLAGGSTADHINAGISTFYVRDLSSWINWNLGSAENK